MGSIYLNNGKPDVYSPFRLAEEMKKKKNHSHSEQYAAPFPPPRPSKSSVSHV